MSQSLSHKNLVIVLCLVLSACATVPIGWKTADPIAIQKIIEVTPQILVVSPQKDYLNKMGVIASDFYANYKGDKEAKMLITINKLNKIDQTFEDQLVQTYAGELLRQNMIVSHAELLIGFLTYQIKYFRP